jgi:hypothetical protein
MDLFGVASVMTRRLIATLRGRPEDDAGDGPEPARFFRRDSVAPAPG